MTSSPANVTLNASLDLEQQLVQVLGPRMRSEAELVVLTIIYSVIFVTGLVGNISTCIVITRNTYMHTSTNYYLFSLAMSDLLTLIIGLPPELYSIWSSYPWVFGEPFCILKVFITETTWAASVLTITAFTVERYVAICHPIRAQTMSTLGRAVRIIVVVWLASALAALPFPVHSGTFYYVSVGNHSIPDSLVCNMRPESMSTMKYFFQLSTFILFIVPMVLITVLYVMIGVTLRRSSGVRRHHASVRHVGNDATRSGTSWPAVSQSRATVLKMLDCCYRKSTTPPTSADTRVRPLSAPLSTCTSSDTSASSVTRQHSNASRWSKNSQTSHKMAAISRSPPSTQSSILIMLIAVVVAFFICWAPFHAQRLMTAFVPENDWTATLLEIQSVLFYISGVLYFVNSTVNPLLYNLMSRKYRQAFTDTMCSFRLSAEDQRLLRQGRLRSRFRSDRFSQEMRNNGANRRSYSPRHSPHTDASPTASRLHQPPKTTADIDGSYGGRCGYDPVCLGNGVALEMNSLSSSALLTVPCRHHGHPPHDNSESLRHRVDGSHGDAPHSHSNSPSHSDDSSVRFDDKDLILAPKEESVGKPTFL